MMNRHSHAALARYSAFALPLAMAALPVYIVAPKFYADDLGLGLAVTGLVLLGARLVDTLQDPLLGHWADRWFAGRRGPLIAVSAPPLALGFVGLFNPPAWDGLALAVWLALMLVLIYSAFSLATIAYQAWGAELSADPHERTRITAFRESLSLVGVLLAAALPQWMQAHLGARLGLTAFSGVFVALLVSAAVVTVAAAPRPGPGGGAHLDFIAALRGALANRGFRRLAAVYLVNGMAAAVPATLVLFYVDSILGLEQWAGAFLAVYFLSGAAGMPLWVRLSRHWGKRGAWLASMGVAVLAFVWAFFLGAGDAIEFTVICAMSGLALGADLALPPSMLADVIDRDGGGGRRGGSYFGLWSLLSKLSLASAAGVGLPLLAWLGYQPGGEAGAGSFALAAVYALLPCALKLTAAGMLWARPHVSAASVKLGISS